MGYQMPLDPTCHQIPHIIRSHTPSDPRHHQIPHTIRSQIALVNYDHSALACFSAALAAPIFAYRMLQETSNLSRPRRSAMRHVPTFVASTRSDSTPRRSRTSTAAASIRGEPPLARRAVTACFATYFFSTSGRCSCRRHSRRA